jgi:hypothetical protein
MALGKASIEKRVAKAAEPAAEEVKAVESAPVEVEVKPAQKKTTTKKTTSCTAKKAPAKKPAAPKAEPTTGVIANVSPEVVEKVVGHEENAEVEHVQIGTRMPSYLL